MYKNRSSSSAHIRVGRGPEGGTVLGGVTDSHSEDSSSGSWLRLRKTLHWATRSCADLMRELANVTNARATGEVIR